MGKRIINFFLITCLIYLVLFFSAIEVGRVKGTSCLAFTVPFHVYSESNLATNIEAKKNDVIYFCGE